MSSFCNKHINAIAIFSCICSAFSFIFMIIFMLYDESYTPDLHSTDFVLLGTYEIKNNGNEDILYYCDAISTYNNELCFYNYKLTNITDFINNGPCVNQTYFDNAYINTAKNECILNNPNESDQYYQIQFVSLLILIIFFSLSLITLLLAICNTYITDPYLNCCCNKTKKPIVIDNVNNVL